MGNSSHRDATEVEILERESQIIQRRRQGQTFDVIAKEMGYANRSGPFKVFQKAVARMRAEINESADELRWTEHQRNEAILRGGLWQRAQRGEHVAIQDFLAIQKSTREMFGLDAPKTSVLQGPRGQPLLSGEPTAADAARLVREMFGDHAAKEPPPEAGSDESRASEEQEPMGEPEGGRFDDEPAEPGGGGGPEPESESDDEESSD